MSKEAILKRVRLAPEGCWLWTGCINPGGYGRLGGRLAHRVSYEVFVGEIPVGLTLDHLCYVTACVRPEHLEPVTIAENLRRQRSASKTECKSGHQYTPANTYIRPSGQRDCRECIRIRAREYQRRRRAA